VAIEQHELALALVHNRRKSFTWCCFTTICCRVFFNLISGLGCHFQKLCAKRWEPHWEAGVLYGLTAMLIGAVVQVIPEA
jgi:hypothetical protein